MIHERISQESQKSLTFFIGLSVEGSLQDAGGIRRASWRLLIKRLGSVASGSCCWRPRSLLEALSVETAALKMHAAFRCRVLHGPYKRPGIIIDRSMICKSIHPAVLQRLSIGAIPPAPVGEARHIPDIAEGLQGF